MEPFVPKISEDDIERLISRDYRVEEHDDIRSCFFNVNVKERNRVIAACLKIGGGDFPKLKGELLNANGYWREIIAEAENPKIKKAGKYSKSEIYEKQKQQYLKWFIG